MLYNLHSVVDCCVTRNAIVIDGDEVGLVGFYPSCEAGS